MHDSPIEPLAVTVPVALRLSGLGRTKLYELIAAKKLESTTIGTRRLINYASLKALLSQQNSSTMARGAGSI